MCALLGAEGIVRHLFFEAMHGNVLPPKGGQHAPGGVDEVDVAVAMVPNANRIGNQDLTAEVRKISHVQLRAPFSRIAEDNYTRLRFTIT